MFSFPVTRLERRLKLLTEHIGVWRWSDVKGGMRFAFPPYAAREALSFPSRRRFNQTFKIAVCIRDEDFFAGWQPEGPELSG